MIALSDIDESERSRTVASDLPSVLASLCHQKEAAPEYPTVPGSSFIGCFDNQPEFFRWQALLQTWGTPINTPFSSTSWRKALTQGLQRLGWPHRIQPGNTTGPPAHPTAGETGLRR